jgi:hypothetical protein
MPSLVHSLLDCSHYVNSSGVPSRRTVCPDDHESILQHQLRETQMQPSLGSPARHPHLAHPYRRGVEENPVADHCSLGIHNG